jgi:anti-anti-sigma factor
MPARSLGCLRYTTAAAKRPLSLQISTRESAGVTIVDLDGRATIGDTNDCLNQALRDLVLRGAHKLLLNLADLTQVDSSSIGTIAGMFVSLNREGGSLKLLRPRGRVRTALDVMRLLEFIPNFEDEAEALASFEQRGHSAVS